ncbi:alpha/beta hydrolase family protein [Paraliobacillus sediminis]|uniref:alpha/beta hydrolase family protein n=1 Tax=Paraliobacillus sediminis TaxID=1885916 RepID=UPI0013C2D53F|nr:alpha/beta hydrolase family protein [Paraliobacillus sediminis]
MGSVEVFLDTLYKEVSQSNPIRDEQAFRVQLRADISRTLGHFDYVSKDGHAIILEKKEMEGYTRLRLQINTIGALRMSFYLLIPRINKREKVPAVIAVHGHGYGSREIIGLNPDGNETEEPGIYKDFAVELVKKGVVVLVPELVGFGDRKLEEDNNEENSCYRIASQLLLCGKTLAGLRVAECRRLLDYIESYDLIDANKIGIMGLSGGGLVAGFTSILDQRIQATVISGYTNTFKNGIMARRHCLDNYIPNILSCGELPDLIGLIAPRPLFIEAGKSDHLFPIETVKTAMDKLKKIYNLQLADNNLASHLFEGGHEISGELSNQWLIEQLAAG